MSGSGYILSWGSFWAYYKECPDELKNENFNQVSEEFLRKIVRSSEPHIVKEVLEYAPEDIQELVGYKTTETEIDYDMLATREQRLALLRSL